MFADFQRPFTRFRGQLFLRGGRNLSLSASEEDRGGIELASQQRLTRLTFSTHAKNRDRACSHFVAMLHGSIVD